MPYFKFLLVLISILNCLSSCNITIEYPPESTTHAACNYKSDFFEIQGCDIKSDVLTLYVEIDPIINQNFNLKHFLLYDYSSSIFTENSEINKIIIMTTDSKHEFTSSIKKITELKNYNKFKEYLYWFKNHPSFINNLNSIDEFTLSFNEDLIEKDKVDIRYGFLWFVFYLNYRSSQHLEKFMVGMSYMYAIGGITESRYEKLRTVLEKGFYTAGLEVPNWKELMSSIEERNKE
jgi:hypothetical protein